MGDSLSLSPHWKRWGPLCLPSSPLLSWLTEQREVSTPDFYPLYASQMKYNVTQNAWILKEQICVSVVWFGSLGNLPRRGRGWKTAGPSWSCGANSRLRESSTDTGPGSTEQVFFRSHLQSLARDGKRGNQYFSISFKTCHFSGGACGQLCFFFIQPQLRY